MSADTLMIHADDLLNNKHIDNLATALKQKMWLARVNKGRKGWHDDSTQQSLNRQLWEHLFKGDPLDVANYCMMLHAKGQSIEPTLVDQMRVLVFDDMGTRLAYGTNDEASIGPYEVLGQLNRIASESGAKSEVQKNSDRYELFTSLVLGDPLPEEMTPIQKDLHDLLSVRNSETMTRKQLNEMIDNVLAKHGK